jgi:hypothetical protein
MTPIEQALGEGGEVAVRLTASGTHTGAFTGIEPTGNDLEIGTIAIVTLEDAKDRRYLLTEGGLIRGPDPPYLARQSCRPQATTTESSPSLTATAPTRATHPPTR